MKAWTEDGERKEEAGQKGSVQGEGKGDVCNTWNNKDLQIYILLP